MRDSRAARDESDRGDTRDSTTMNVAIVANYNTNFQLGIGNIGIGSIPVGRISCQK